MLKFPVDGGIVTIRSTILIPAECAPRTTSSKEILKEAEVRHENFKVALHPNFSDQEVAIRGTLSAKGRTELCSLLKENLDIFAWKPSDMTGVPRSVAEHRLNIREGYSPDCYPLPEIDWKVESLCGYPFKCFLDAYKGYHQIQMTESDEEKTAFHISHGVYCYTKMPFGLKNAGATYQRLVDKAFDSQVGQNKEVFLSKSTEKSLPIFKTLKKCIKKSDIHWTSEAEHAFKQLKQHFSELPMLVAPKPKEELIAFLFASHEAIRPRAKLYLNGKASPSTSFRSQEVTKIFPSASYRSYHRPTHQTNNITPRCSRAITKIERHAGRTQYHVPAKDIRERIDPSGFPCREAGRKTHQIRKWLKPRQEPWKCSWMDSHVWMDGCWPNTKQAHRERRLDSANGVRMVHVSVDSKTGGKTKVLGTLLVEEEGPTWMTPIIEYLKDGTLPDDKKEASKLRIKARQYELLEGVLYRRSFLKPWLSMHAGPRSVVTKAMRLGYYWATMHRDARDIIRKCNDCQIPCPVPRNPQQPLTPITAPWPFYKWGIDIAGPFLEGPGKVKFLIVAMDYFTKWIKAKAVATITGSQVKKFVWDNIVCRFGLPGEIVSDNGKQFSDNPFKDWCEKLNITQRFTSVKHQQSNRLVERANMSLGEGIKARLGEGNKN
ncbi:reverse transcriptase domain-containing protein [Tanacetum coccineum]